ncbi:flavin reductase family protein [Demequina sp. NBRC 110054]|uniref:flavin reductase family protein n=1 Tax=Demequina sp. NBRC 110054 TaxID=1570343 RepID=UPI0013565B68|nr:flavin reductase family protein [Demequina sp. NBRC 110054]
MTELHTPDATRMRRTLGRFATGVTIVSDRDLTGRLSAMTVNSFTSLSLDPALILVCVRNGAAMAAGLTEPGHPFGVSVLAAHQGELAAAMARRDRDASRAQGFVDMGAAPVVEGAVAQIVARVEAVHPGGDHVIVVGKVEALRAVDGPPLLFLDGALAS